MASSRQANVAGTPSRRDRPMTDSDEAAEHLADVEDGCGCAEVWEHLSAERDETSSDE